MRDAVDVMVDLEARVAQLERERTLVGLSAVVLDEDQAAGTRNNGAYGDLSGADVGPAITIGRAGLYLVRIEATVAGTGVAAIISYTVNATAASDDDWAISSISTEVQQKSIGRTRPKTLAAGDVLTVRYRTSGAVTFANRLIFAVPTKGA